MRASWGVLVVAGLAAAANADLRTGFESPRYNGSAAGVGTAGQQGWTVPAGIDTRIYTYAGNTPGFVSQTGRGGDQFLGSRSDGGVNFGRAQHTNDFSDKDVWHLSYDFAAMWTGTGASAANLSSFSLQHTNAAGTFRQFIALNNWTDNNAPTLGWKAEYNVFDAAGTALNNQSPGAAWTNLAINHWYRQTTVIDFSNNSILKVAIEDLTTGVKSEFFPTGWHMTGGAASTLTIPIAVRMFSGGNAGNEMGWDNLAVTPSPAGLAVLGLGLLAGGRRRR